MRWTKWMWELKMMRTKKKERKEGPTYVCLPFFPCPSHTCTTIVNGWHLFFSPYDIYNYNKTKPADIRLSPLSSHNGRQICLWDMVPQASVSYDLCNAPIWRVMCAERRARWGHKIKRIRPPSFFYNSFFAPFPLHSAGQCERMPLFFFTCLTVPGALGSNSIWFEPITRPSWNNEKKRTSHH